MRIYDILLSMLHGLMYLPIALMLTIMACATWASVSAKRSSEESLRILGNSLCPYCRRAFGPTAALQTAQCRVRHLRELHAQNPGVKLRIPSLYPITCPWCGRRSNFDWQQNELRAEDDNA
jgi:uncharacterized Zn-finger protein